MFTMNKHSTYAARCPPTWRIATVANKMTCKMTSLQGVYKVGCMPVPLIKYYDSVPFKEATKSDPLQKRDGCFNLAKVISVAAE